MGEEISESMGNGSYIDSTNSDLTFGQIHSALGQRQGLLNASEFEEMLERFNMLGKIELISSLHEEIQA